MTVTQPMTPRSWGSILKKAYSEEEKTRLNTLFANINAWLADPEKVDWAVQGVESWMPKGREDMPVRAWVRPELAFIWLVVHADGGWKAKVTESGSMTPKVSFHKDDHIPVRLDLDNPWKERTYWMTGQSKWSLETDMQVVRTILGRWVFNKGWSAYAKRHRFGPYNKDEYALNLKGAALAKTIWRVAEVLLSAKRLNAAVDASIAATKAKNAERTATMEALRDRVEEVFGDRSLNLTLLGMSALVTLTKDGYWEVKAEDFPTRISARFGKDDLDGLMVFLEMLVFDPADLP